jgi:hypothetical protein
MIDRARVTGAFGGFGQDSYKPPPTVSEREREPGQYFFGESGRCRQVGMVLVWARRGGLLRCPGWLGKR